MYISVYLGSTSGEAAAKERRKMGRR